MLQVAIIADGGTTSRIQKKFDTSVYFISSRTPPPRSPQNGNADSEVELGEAERCQAAAGLDEDDEADYNSKRPVVDWRGYTENSSG